MLVGGLVLVAIAVAALFFARSSRSRQQAFAGTERSGCSDLAELARAVSSEAGPGSFRQPAEVEGEAQPGPGGPLIAPLSGRPCVWYRATVTERTWRKEQTGTGENRRTERRERSDVVSDEASQDAIAIHDGTGAVLVDPRSAEFDDPEVSIDRFEPAEGAQGGGTRVEALGASVTFGADEGLLGYHRREQLIPAGRRLYVLGEARDASGALEIGKPEGKGRFVISGRSEGELTASAGRTATIATAVAGVAGLAGVVLVVLGALG